jgi:O-6-methylguanine DNA methyltransferase
MKINLIDTPIGKMICKAKNNEIIELTFLNKDLKEEITESCEIIEKTKEEIKRYFLGELKEFSVTTKQNGTVFQQKAWDALKQTEYGKTLSYKNQCQIMGLEKAHRAVGNANAANKFHIIVPCHRVIRENMNISGFARGSEKKAWLIRHEQSYK